MPTPKQVEAVARALAPVDWDHVYDDFPADDWHHRQRRESIIAAKHAIAAYEATTAPVVSDEELLAAYDAGCDKATAQYMREHNGVPDWPAPERNYHRTYDLAGIRAVRARLEGE